MSLPPPPDDLSGLPPGIVEPDERVVWIGRPARAHRFGVIETAGLLGAAGAVAWHYLPDAILSLFGAGLGSNVSRVDTAQFMVEIVLWALAVYLVVIRVPVIILATRRLGFIVTNRRALICNIQRGEVLGAAQLAQDSEIETDITRSGIGTVAVGHRGMAGATFFRITGLVWPWLMEGGVFFYEVSDAAAVADRIRDGLAATFD